MTGSRAERLRNDVLPFVKPRPVDRSNMHCHSLAPRANKNATGGAATVAVAVGRVPVMVGDGICVSVCVGVTVGDPIVGVGVTDAGGSVSVSEGVAVTVGVGVIVPLAVGVKVAI